MHDCLAVELNAVDVTFSSISLVACVYAHFHVYPTRLALTGFFICRQGGENGDAVDVDSKRREISTLEFAHTDCKFPLFHFQLDLVKFLIIFLNSIRPKIGGHSSGICMSHFLFHIVIGYLRSFHRHISELNLQ